MTRQQNMLLFFNLRQDHLPIPMKDYILKYISVIISIVAIILNMTGIITTDAIALLHWNLLSIICSYSALLIFTYLTTNRFPILCAISLVILLGALITTSYNWVFLANLFISLNMLLLYLNTPIKTKI